MTTAQDSQIALVGDIGGTNARFALADVSGAHPRIFEVREYSSKNYASGGDAVGAYLAEVRANPAVAAIAVAGPITHGAAILTNLGWTFTETELLGLGFRKAHLLNDFEALALATQHFEAKDVHLIGTVREGEPESTVAVIGPGTGFGASALVRGRGHAIALAAEGGHASFAPCDEVEREILAVLARKYRQVSIERVLSGPGLQNLHDALNEIEGVKDDARLPAEISERALKGEALHSRTLHRFCLILGSVAGDFALIYGARGGVFIAGGIGPMILSALDPIEFRRRFEAKGRFKSYLAAVPTHVILHGHAAFLGAADHARRLARALT
jgi:glucokinase